MTPEIKRLRALLKETDDPGPWKHGSRNGGYECVRNANGDLVAKMGGIGAPAKKRARVIASPPLLLDVAEAALRHVEEKFPRSEAEACDFGPEECSACNLEQAIARLGEGR